MQIFKQIREHIFLSILLLACVVFVSIFTSSDKLRSIIIHNSAAVIGSTKKNHGTIEDYVLNIFCTEKYKTYIKAVSGSGVFLSDPDENTGIILTNAHVARHLLDGKKKCVGRTGSPAVTTHSLTLRYIPSYWLDEHNQYIIGDPDKSSTGEFDFALIEVKKTQPNKKTNTNIYSTFRQKLQLKLNGYKPSYFSSIDHYIYSYPAQKTLAGSIYSPLYRKKDQVQIGDIFQSPTLRTTDSLLDAIGSKNVDHGSSGGMMLAVDTSFSLVGLSSILIKDTHPQTVRIVTIRHIFDVLQNELRNSKNAQISSFKQIISDILNQTKVESDIYSILKNQKLTGVLEQNTRETLIRLRIIK